MVTLSKACMRTCAWLGTLKVASVCKVSFILGSVHAFFSATSLVAPLVGAFTSTGQCMGVFALTLLLRTLFSGLPAAHYLAYHIPGFCAALYWNSRSAWLAIGLPVLSILLFIVHPNATLSYALWWIVPIILHLTNKNSLFMHALTSTFIAHAVGSVIWIYTMPTSPLLWYLLLPIVPVERLAFASGMVLIVKMVQGLKGCSWSSMRYPLFARH